MSASATNAIGGIGLAEIVERDLSEIKTGLAEMRTELKAVWKRIDEHQALTESVHKLALSMCTATAEVKQLRIDLEAMRKDIDEIKARPTKRWDTAMAAGIAGVISVLISLVFKG